MSYEHHEDDGWGDEQYVGAATRFLGEYKVDPKYLTELLGFQPPRKMYLPIDAVRSAITAAAEAWLDLQVKRGVCDPTPEEVRGSPAVKKALINLYVHLATYSARRCPAPIPVQYPMVRELFAALVKELHLAIPDAPPLDVEVVFIGKEIPEDERDPALVLQRGYHDA